MTAKQKPSGERKPNIQCERKPNIHFSVHYRPACVHVSPSSADSSPSLTAENSAVALGGTAPRRPSLPYNGRLRDPALPRVIDDCSSWSSVLGLILA